ncbi:MAG: hypothetical protein J4400_00090 [Candidatus Aenigmarchaeota archaeon]|nr:hypothetical protein [Candidatus Aenigmarchaeota archaeon]
MRKLRCRDYLNHANTKENLYTYTGHLFGAHRRNLPKVVKLIHLSTSSSFNQQAYQEVCSLAEQVESNYRRTRR